MKSLNKALFWAFLTVAFFVDSTTSQAQGTWEVYAPIVSGINIHPIVGNSADAESWESATNMEVIASFDTQFACENETDIGNGNDAENAEGWGYDDEASGTF
ncbi:MAG: hypothetical protein M2R45_00362 [Verrucomicrobia subdivision 3 bacterium]|nr:hypothetical protein [Limisphaerales bacterium]MCS1412880.1 hypothetical protein [Limisphaerales bacterium]